MVQNVSSLASANRALREERLEDAVSLYASAQKEAPAELGKHIDFNLRCISRILQDEETNPIVAGSLDSPPSKKQLPQHDVVVVLLARSLNKAAETARLLSRRANYPMGFVVLLTEPLTTQVEHALESLLGTLKAKYVLITSQDAFPGRQWLERAYGGLTQHAENIVYANTGSDAIKPAWMDALATPTVLQEILRGDRRGEAERTVEQNFLLVDIGGPTQSSLSAIEWPVGLDVVDVGDLQGGGTTSFSREVCVVMPCLDAEAGQRTARLLVERAGMEADVVVAVDSARQGFIPTLNQVARRSRAKYIVYLAEDAWPGQGWLRTAYERIQSAEKKLLAFNCGKWHGRVAAFGMVDKAWAYGLYGDQVLFQGYQSHRADNELSAIARAQGEFIYAPECILAEHDSLKDFRRSEREASNFQRADARLFRERFRNGFEGLVDPEKLGPLHDEYLDLPKFYGNRPQLRIS